MRSVASMGGVIGTMVKGGRSSRGDSTAGPSVGAAFGVGWIDTRRTPPMSPPVVRDRFVGPEHAWPITRRDYLDRGGVPRYGRGMPKSRMLGALERWLLSPGPSIDELELAGHEPGFRRGEEPDGGGAVSEGSEHAERVPAD